MDLPIHLASGALIGTIMISAQSRILYGNHSQPRRVKVGIACFLLGVLSHLLLDAVPHYDWLFYITFFKPLPFWWLIPQVIVSLPVLLFSPYLMRDSPYLALAALTGGIYPDVEKLAFYDFNLPRELVIFRAHSCFLSQWTPWEAQHKTFLVLLEVVLLPALLGATYWVSRRRNPRLVEHLRWDTWKHFLTIKIRRKQHA